MLSCQQVNYFPWLGYFEQIKRSEKFVFLDDVQWIRQGRQHRTRILSPQGEDHKFWLTVPVHGGGHREKTLKDMRVDRSQSWAKRHWRTIAAVYGKAPHFKTQLEPLLRPFFEKAETMEFLTEVCQESIFLFWDELGLNAELHWSADWGIEQKSEDKIIAICHKLEAAEYYSALGSTRYMNLESFRNAGISVRWQHFRKFPRTDYSILDFWANRPKSEILRLLEGPTPLISREYASLS